jgi:hypothetical protein
VSIIAGMRKSLEKESDRYFGGYSLIFSCDAFC